MRLPPEPVLVAAKRWLELLPASGGIRRAQALLTTHPEFSDLTPTQYATALAWLSDLGLLEHADSPVPPPMRVIGAIFERAAPPWVQDSDRLVQSPDELPPDIVSVGEALGMGPDAVYGQLVSSWGKVDTTARELVGAAGEAALVTLLRAAPEARVDHVSALSDGFGYDIAYVHGSVVMHLEVKSTTRVNRFTAYLSRHEYSVMERDARWVLAAVRLTDDSQVAGVGSIPREWILTNAPRDNSQFGSWHSAKLEVPADVITSGIPNLPDAAAILLPGW